MIKFRPLLITFLKWLGVLETGFPLSYPLREYYVVAFEANFKDAWKNTPFASDISLREFCYARALTCLYGDRQEDYVDRRALLYTYLKNVYATLTSEGFDDIVKTLNRFKQTLPIESNIQPIMRRITKLYDERPTREFTTNPTLQSDLSDLYNEMQFDTFIKNAYQLTKFVGVCAIRQYWYNGKPTMIIKTPDQYGIRMSAEDDTKIDEFWEPVIYERKFAFRVWGEKTKWIYKPINKIINLKGAVTGEIKRTDEEPNEYGRIPYSFLWLNGGRLDLAETQLKINRTTFQAENNSIFSAEPIGIAYNIEKGLISGAADEMILAPQTIEPDVDGLIVPEIRYFQPETAYTELMQYNETRWANAQRAEGIPNSVILGNINPPSGISRLLEMTELLERKREDEPVLIEFEKDLAELIIIISNVDAAKKYGDIEFNITYPREAIRIDPEAEYKFDKQKVKDLAMPVKEYFIKWGSFPNDIKDDELLAELKTRSEANNAVKELLPKQGTELETPVTDEIDKQIENIQEEVK